MESDSIIRGKCPHSHTAWPCVRSCVQRAVRRRPFRQSVGKTELLIDGALRVSWICVCHRYGVRACVCAPLEAVPPPDRRRVEIALAGGGLPPHLHAWRAARSVGSESKQVSIRMVVPAKGPIGLGRQSSSSLPMVSRSTGHRARAGRACDGVISALWPPCRAPGAVWCCAV